MMSDKITTVVPLATKLEDLPAFDSFIHYAKGIVISLCDLTGNFVTPWVERGYSVVMVDPQHKYTRIEPGDLGENRGDVIKVAEKIEDVFHVLGRIIRSGKVVFVAGFPPCTDVSVSGARWWKLKAKRDRYFQAKAAIVAEQCRTIGAVAGCPWFFENPVSAFSNIFGKPSHTFHPWEYTAHCADDNYTKTTCLWTGGGFVMPPTKVNKKLGEPDVTRIHYASPGPDRENERSETPKGFSRAVFKANVPA